MKNAPAPKLDMSHVRAIVRHLKPVSTKSGRNNDFALQFASLADAQEAAKLLRARGYNAAQSPNSLSVTGSL